MDPVFEAVCVSGAEATYPLPATVDGEYVDDSRYLTMLYEPHECTCNGEYVMILVAMFGYHSEAPECRVVLGAFVAHSLPMCGSLLSADVVC